MLGQTVGTYRITGKLSEGGMGVVYRAEHTLLGRAAAIKLILPALSANREVVQRFFAEARVTSVIRHAGIVEIYDFGYHDDGRAYLVMELLAGESLGRRLARVRRMDEVAVALVGRGVAGALAAAHAHGVIHRDLKPDNVFLVPDPDAPGGERPKLLDFGIAKLGGAPLDGDARITRADMLMGTPAYMSPEQCRGGGVVDARADLYALGCMLYEALAGRPPFVALGSGAVMAAHLCTEPTPIEELVPEVAPALASLIMRLLAKDPDHRTASALDAVAELTAFVADRVPAGWIARIPTPLAHPVVVATTLGSAVRVVTTRRREPPGPTRPWWIAVAATVMAAAALVAAWSTRPVTDDRREVVVHAAPPLDAAPADAALDDAAPADAAPADAAPAVDAPVPIDAGVPTDASNPPTRRSRPGAGHRAADAAPGTGAPPLVDELDPIHGPLVDELDRPH